MKITVFFIIAIILTLFLIGGNMSNKTVTALNAETQQSAKSINDARIDFIVGSWTGTGFITDATGAQQYIEIRETNSRISNNEYQIVGIGKNPTNQFTYTYNKALVFNAAINEWVTKGTINNIILPECRTTLGNNNVISYSYSDLNRVAVRHITARDTDGSLTETQEKWGQNGWDKTAWFRMTRNSLTKNNTPFSQ